MIAAMLYLGYYAEMRVSRTPSFDKSLLAVATGCIVVFVLAAVLNRATLWQMRRKNLSQQNRRRRAAFADVFLRTMLVGAYITVLEHSDLPWVCVDWLGKQVENGDSFWFQLPGLGLYVLLFFCAWLPMYGLHKETNWGRWTRTSFLVHKARYNLYMLLAWLPFALLADWLSGFILALPVLFLGAAWIFPWLLAKVWGCTRVTNGPVLEIVRKLEQRAQGKFSRIYMWEPGGATQNAAAVGIFRPFRYLFLTPALVRNMPGAELEAVILHELGHVKKKHLLFYMFTSLAGINLTVILGAMIPLAGTTERFIITAVLILAYFRLVFGWLSRNMERQADLFSLEQSGSSIGLVNALEKLALSLGHVRRSASWHHMGVAERVDFLRRAERNPAIGRWHNTHVRHLMIAGYALSFCVLAGMTWMLHDEWRTPAFSAPASIQGGEAHWRRVMRLMPGNATAPLELAYQLAANSARHGEAVELARRVLAMQCGAREKAAAQKLLAELENVAETTRRSAIRGPGLSSLPTE
jgi:Zn-dependent protease with chaperone function